VLGRRATTDDDPPLHLDGADLRGADLSGAQLAGARLDGANLKEANLHRANLQEADLQGADLTEADLQGADLTGANLQGALTDHVRWPDGFDPQAASLTFVRGGQDPEEERGTRLRCPVCGKEDKYRTRPRRGSPLWTCSNGHRPTHKQEVEED
jgi:hypothetical protein